MKNNAFRKLLSPNQSQENSDKPAEDLDSVKSIGGLHCRCGTARARERFRGLCAGCYLTERIAEGSWDPKESLASKAGKPVTDEGLS